MASEEMYSFDASLLFLASFSHQRLLVVLD